MTRPVLIPGMAAIGVAAGGLAWGVIAGAGLPPGLAGPVAGLAAALSGGAAALVAWRVALVPAGRLARAIRAARESRSSEPALPGLGRAHALGPLAEETDALITALGNARREARKTARAEAARIDAEKAWLEAILQGLSEGVFVCNRQHRIMLCNRAADRLMGDPERMGLGRPLTGLLAAAPLEHSLGRLQRGASGGEAGGELSAPFLCAAQDGSRLFHGRMALVRDPQGSVTGYILTLADMAEELAQRARDDAVRRTLTRDLRGTVANLRAAAETLVAFPAMPPEDRARFEAVLTEEAERMSGTLDALGEALRGHLLGHWPMADIHVTDFVDCVRQALEDRPDIALVPVGMPLWLHGDTLSLVAAVELLIRQIVAMTGAASFDVEALLADRRVYLDISWDGAPVPAQRLSAWMDAPCGGAMAGQTLRDVLDRHNSEPWSQAGKRAGRAILRLPLPAPTRPQFAPEPRQLPPRPEFYDFGLMQEMRGDDSLNDRRLSELAYVVFDCEMTGLEPTRGDEIIQIGAVRVVGGRILTGETFERLVHPGRPIPPASIRFHGITDADVADRPGILQVLPAFRDFVGDAVMVAHNAAFDMKFLRLKEGAAGLRFDRPVLDTLLLAAMVEGEGEDVSLDALCARYGIAVSGRHTALGDTMATAELLLRLIDRLEARGIATLGQVLKKSNMAAELRQREAVFAATGGA